MTGTLKVRYVRPTPLHQELLFDAEITRVEGRKIFTEGRVRSEGVLTAEAQAVFISINPAKMIELARLRDAWESRQES